MVALAANTPRPSRNIVPNSRIAVPVNGGSRIYAGSLVMVDADGFARPAAALASNGGCIGVAIAEANNTNGADGDIDVVVEQGQFLFTATSAAQTNLNELFYASTDNDVDETQGVNEPVAGRQMEFVSATQVWIFVGRNP